MRAHRVLGQTTLPLAVWLSISGLLVACGGRDSIFGGPFETDDDGSSGGRSGGVGGRAAGGKSAATGGTSAAGFPASTGAVGGFGVGGTAGNGNPAGGDTAVGGSATSGASSTSGGSSAGGFDAGGFSAGGFPTGGFSSGGFDAGGFSAGGFPNGGFPTGGFSSGGFPAGGFPNGGSSQGGTGGSATGGSGGGVGQLGAACSESGALACHGAAQRLRLLCDGGTWKTNGTCVESENCDRRSGVCSPIATGCAGKEPGQRICSADELRQCGPDLVTVDIIQACSGRCVTSASSADCAPPRCGDGKVENQEQCDDGDDDDHDSCTTACRLAICGDGAIYTEYEKCDDGNAVANDGCSVMCGSDAVAIGAGSSYTCGLGTSGGVQCWGSNANGQLGVGDTGNRGASTYDMGAHLPIVALGSGKTVTAVAVGPRSNCAILNDGSVKCWGSNYYGQLGLGDTATRGTAKSHLGDNLAAVPLGTGRTAVAISVGGFHSCALLDDQSVKCWGWNSSGQLGQGDFQSRGDVPFELGDALLPIELGTGQKAKAIGTGAYHTCALLTDGSVKCWGYNYYGQLGLGDSVVRGAQPGEMGDALPSVNLGSGRKAVSLAVADSHACVVLDNATIKCWGDNSGGQLGLGDQAYRGDNVDEMGDNLPAVALGTGHTAKAVAVGPQHSCALLGNDQVKCWGYNSYGALGIGDTNTRGDDSNELGDTLPQVSLGSGRSAKALAVGDMHTCALLDNNAIKCWGNNNYGQLGVGNSHTYGDGPSELGDNLPYVVVTF